MLSIHLNGLTSWLLLHNSTTATAGTTNVGVSGKLERNFRALLLKYGYPEDLVSGWSAEDCEAEWDHFCSKVIQE
ncbi:hypothetical protein [Paenibacillus sp. Z3-2]